MKINKEDLREIIQEQMNLMGMGAPEKQDMLEESYMGGEGRMAQGQLKRIAELAELVASKFDDNSNLEEWVESKITKAEDYLSSVLNYMEGKD
jgi:hypothetical protein